MIFALEFAFKYFPKAVFDSTFIFFSFSSSKVVTFSLFLLFLSITYSSTNGDTVFVYPVNEASK